MRKKQFKAESKKLLDMMINSIYTHKEIFLRELISNGSDAIDKLYFRSLTDESVGMDKEDFHIFITPDKDARTLTIEDNGCGMTADELESNLGTIAKSGSLDFKKDMEEKSEVEIIGQFGVGFYSAFMVSDKVTVLSRAFGEESANLWTSQGADGYTIEPAEKDTAGTVITLYLKEDTEEEKYSDYLETYKITSLVKKYSDYIRYPIMMDVETTHPVEGKEDEYETVTETRTLNSMVPLWRKNKNEITEEEYESFYKDKFYDYTAPAKVIHSKVEGQATYDALLFIPKKAPYDYYTKEYEKGLQLYSNGVLIMDKCPDLLPDYFSFVKGLVDSSDLTLNISRETLQHDYQLKLIARTIEKKIKSELTNMLKNDRENYEEFYKAFGMQLKYGVYESYGANKETLQDLLLFVSSHEDKLTTLNEYCDRMKEDQENIYYACGETKAKIDMLPQVEAVKDKGFEILYFTDNVDEFAIQMMSEYDQKHFVNVCADNLDLSSDEEKEAVKKENEDSKELLDKMKDALGGSVTSVRFTNTLKNHPACLTSEGMVSTEMEKVLNSMPNSNGEVKAETVLEINANHPVAEKLKTLSDENLTKYAKLLYMQARLIGGLTIEDPAEFSSLISELMV
ncbi:MAG: molecular chaperone HtpG [Clostridiales bacterium]|nr:molecular chaperone HtpG [Clostridiales bacterium]